MKFARPKLANAASRLILHFASKIFTNVRFAIFPSRLSSPEASHVTHYKRSAQSGAALARALHLFSYMKLLLLSFVAAVSLTALVGCASDTDRQTTTTTYESVDTKDMHHR